MEGTAAVVAAVVAVAVAEAAATAEARDLGAVEVVATVVGFEGLVTAVEAMEEVAAAMMALGWARVAEELAAGAGAGGRRSGSLPRR